MSTNNPMSNIPPLGPPTGMMPGGGSSKFKPVDPLRVLRANWLWLVFALIVGAVFGGGAWFAMNKYAAKYTSESEFDVQATNIEGLDGRGGGLRMAEIEPWILREVQGITSTPILLQVLQNPDVQKTAWYQQFDNDDDALEDLTDKVIKATHIRDTPLFRVTATTDNEADARVILLSLSSVYMDRKRERLNAEAKRDKDAAIARLNAAEKRIKDIKIERENLQINEPVEALESRTTTTSQQVSLLVRDLGEYQKQFDAIAANRAVLLERDEKGDYEPSDEERLQIEAVQDIVRIDATIFERKVRQKVLTEQLGENHKQVRDLDREILALNQERDKEFRDQAVNLFKSKLERSAQDYNLLQNLVNKTEQELAKLREDNQTFVIRLRKYEDVERKLKQAEDEREASNKVLVELEEIEKTEARVVVTQPVPPQKAKQSFPPEPYLLVPGAAVAFCLLVTGLIFLREVMDQRVRSAADVKMIPDAALLGMIPAAGEDRTSKRNATRVVENQPTGLLAEAYRQVRTSMLSKVDRRGYKTLMMVSAKPSAGVTTIAQNLGASCALSGRRVLIIDANFRRPGMASLMGLSDQPGLADVLCGDQALEQVGSLTQATSTQGLSLLPAGNTAKGAVELFENPRFRDLLARLEAEYDLLIIDAPPALLTSDAQLLSRHIDAMVLVSRAQSDTRGMLERLYRELDGQRADILGIVLNGVQASVGGYLKRNFREFQAYSGPERRNAPRTATTPARTPAAVATTSNGAASNGDDSGFDGFDIDEQDDD